MKADINIQSMLNNFAARLDPCRIDSSSDCALEKGSNIFKVEFHLVSLLWT